MCRGTVGTLIDIILGKRCHSFLPEVADPSPATLVLQVLLPEYQLSRSGVRLRQCERNGIVIRVCVSCSEKWKQVIQTMTATARRVHYV